MKNRTQYIIRMLAEGPLIGLLIAAAGGALGHGLLQMVGVLTSATFGIVVILFSGFGLILGLALSIAHIRATLKAMDTKTDTK